MPEESYVSPYSPNTIDQRQEMLDVIGVHSVEELFRDIPESLRNPPLELPAYKSEFELLNHINDLASKNKSPGDYACFLGAGAYRHYVPAVVRQITSRSEFVTSYTPYQPEVSQGTLQTEYEFQTLCAQLTGMDVANAGMYDGATSMSEGALMACRVTNRRKVCVLNTVSNRYINVLRTYTEAQGISIQMINTDDPGITDEAACVVVQQPNFLGYMEDLDNLAKNAHSHGALLVVSADPMSMVLFKPPSFYDADIVTAEGQGLGVPLTYGGPYVGIFTCKAEYVRQMPGRIVGKTVDTKGRTAYVLTLQTREQHIRRERATSNICTSVALIALMTTVYMAVNGKRGLRQIAELTYQKAHYLASRIEDLDAYALPLTGTFFQEFPVVCPIEPSHINQILLQHNIIGGLDISEQLPNGMLFCASELNTRVEIDRLVTVLDSISDDK